MQPPKPLLIVWYPKGGGAPEPVALVSANAAERKLADFNADSPHLGEHRLVDPFADLLRWSDYHTAIFDYITPSLCEYLSSRLGVEVDTEHTGGGCDALMFKEHINGRVVDVLVTECEDAHAPLLGWTRGVTVGFYDPESGDCLGLTHDYGADGHDDEVPPMTAEEIGDAIVDAIRKVERFTVGDIVTFSAGGDGELLTGMVVETDLARLDGVSTAEWSEPVHRVAVDGGGEWAIHPSWVVGRVGGSVPTRYSITVSFESDRPVSDGELAYLANTLAVQVEEPWTVSVDGEMVEATYRTSDVSVVVEPVKV
jgi:hypothetical protein